MTGRGVLRVVAWVFVGLEAAIAFVLALIFWPTLILTAPATIFMASAVIGYSEPGHLLGDDED